MKALDVVLTLACVLGIAAGQLLFKRAAETWPSPFSVFALARNPWLLTALTVYAVATLGWIYVLRSAPLSVAYPLFALAFLIVPLLSWWLFGDVMRWNQWLGGAIIIVGVWVATAR